MKDIIQNPSVTWEKVTPERAQRWLAQNIANNRPLMQKRVKTYAHDMRAGRWQAIPAPIIFDKDGRLIDGQHRLAAMVESRATLTLLVARGSDIDAQRVIDTGSNRAVGQIVHMAGHANGNDLATLARMVWSWEHGYRGASVYTPPIQPSPTEVLYVIGEHPELPNTIKASWAAYTAMRGAAKSTYAFSYWLFARKHGPSAAEFFAALETGAGLLEGSPILLLRDRLIREARATRQASGAAGGKSKRQYILALFIKAWNAYRCGASLRVLKFTESEEFPEVM